MNSYAEFIKRKAMIDPPTGMASVPELNSCLRDYQKDMVRWALRRGRAAFFADCGLGKGPMQMEFASRQPHECIIAAPLAVAHQFVREAEKFGFDLAYAKDQSEVTKRITVTNFERLENFNIEQFGAVCIDESSILKNSSGSYCNWIIEAFQNTPFRLCSSATPAPNDVMELGTHAEFLGVMTRSEMLAMYFTHDGGDTSKWRVKGHAQTAFWEWLASWAVMIRKPSDLGYSDDGFVLPPLVMHEQCVRVAAPTSGFLFAVEAQTLQERQQARRDSIADRVKACADLINGSGSWANQVLNTGANTTQQTSKSDEQTNEPLINDTKKQGKRQANNGLQMLIKKKSKNGIEGSTLQISIDTKQQAGLQLSGNMDLTSSNSAQCLNHREESAQFADATQKTGVDSTLTTITQPERSGGSCAIHATSYSEGTKTTQLNCQSAATNHLLSTSSEQWLVWTNLNEESRQIAELIPDAVEVKGSDTDAHKEAAIAGFLSGSVRVLVSKPRILGLGLNMQCCANMAYVGLSDSYEQLYQSIRRCWRFGQSRPVNVHVITAETEGAVVSNIKRKEADAEAMYSNMIAHMKDLNAAALHGATLRNKSAYEPSVRMSIPSWMGVAA